MKVSVSFSLFTLLVICAHHKPAGYGSVLAHKVCTGTKAEMLNDPRVCVSRNALNPDFESGSLNPWIETSKGDAEWVIEDAFEPSTGPLPPPPPGGNTKILRLRQWNHFDVAVLRSPPFLAEPGDQITISYWISFEFAGFNNIQVMWIAEGENEKEKLVTDIYSDSFQPINEWRSTTALIPVEYPAEISVVIYGFCGTSSNDALAIQSIAITFPGSQSTPPLTQPAASSHQSSPSAPTEAISTPSSTTVDPKQGCPGFDYSPCSCIDSQWGHQVNCENVKLADVHRALERSTSIYISGLYIALTAQDNIIPANLTCGIIIDAIKIDGSNLSPDKTELEIDQEAFFVEKIIYFTVRHCSVSKLNLDFLAAAVKLSDLDFIGLSNFEKLFPTLPSPPIEKLTLTIDSTPGLGPSLKYPAIFPPITNLYVSNNADVDDLAISLFLQWMLQRSRNILERASLLRNNLTTVPPDLISFAGLYFLDLYGNPISILPTYSIFFKELWGLGCYRCGILEIQPDAIIGNMVKCLTNLQENKLTRFESNVFKTILEMMNSAPIASNAGYVDVEANPFDCDTDVCHLSWLLRDNRRLLKFVLNASCANGIRFEDIPEEAFAECP